METRINRINKVYEFVSDRDRNPQYFDQIMGRLLAEVEVEKESTDHVSYVNKLVGIMDTYLPKMAVLISKEESLFIYLEFIYEVKTTLVGGMAMGNNASNWDSDTR